MLGLQASIGAVNDLVDEPVDRGRKPGKPLSRGAVTVGEARLVAALALVAGLVLAALSGPATLAVAAVGTALGYAYDLRLSRTAWSWLPLALALPLVPAYAWLGGVGTLPEGFAAVGPAALLGGAGLALGNGIVDEERDRAAGIASAVVRLGRRRAWLVHAVCLTGLVGVAWLFARRPADASLGLVTVGLAVGTGVIALGVVLAGRSSPLLRERGWEVEALGVTMLGVAWLAGLAAPAIAPG